MRHAAALLVCLCALLAASATLQAQEADPAAQREAAQAQVHEARKLLKLQRPADAIPLLEEAYLILEDPELLRILGDAWAAQGDPQRAVALWDSYLAEPSVGDSAKAPVREQRARLLASKTSSDKKEEGDEDEGDFLDEQGITGWGSHGASNGRDGRPFLQAGARLLYNVGPSFETPLGGSSDQAASTVTGDYIHGGLGLNLGGGLWVTETSLLGLVFGLDWMNWEARAPTEAFGTRVVPGYRPEVALEGRYVLGGGFGVGLTAGADAVIVDGGEGTPSGLYGWRLLTGLTAAYQTPVSDSLHIQIDTSVRVAPLFVSTSDATDALPSYTDLSWLVQFGVGMGWTL